MKSQIFVNWGTVFESGWLIVADRSPIGMELYTYSQEHVIVHVLKELLHPIFLSPTKHSRSLSR